MKKKKKRVDIFTLILILLVLVGLSLILYPSFSNYWNLQHQTTLIADYASEVDQLDEVTYDQLLNDAREYNRKLFENHKTLGSLSDSELELYNSLLDIYDDGMMGYIEIPSIKVNLPIFHGTSEETLQVAAGHIEGSSLPVGGESTHCVISGHRGLPSAKLFSNLDKLSIGDTFILYTLDETLTYEVDQILIVEPDDLSALSIVEGEDLCTLVTCTPYGVNTHRLLVRGHRIENLDDSIRITADALQIEPRAVAPFMAIPIVIAMLIYVFASNKDKHKKS